MIGKNLARRLERLEAQTTAANEDKLEIVVQYASTDGELSEAFRVTVPNKPSKLRRWPR
jgi:hypothetical protein